MSRLPGLALADHTFTVPLDHRSPHGPTIEVFARSVVDPARAGEELPWLLYLEGGPGGKSPRPGRANGWLAHAVKSHRVLLLDQRGTGRSTPVTARAAAGWKDHQALAAYLRHFRADSIVADCELIRRWLCGDQPWETLGQSYGGFITLTYLSFAPQGLRRCYVTGGLPGLDATADDVYRRTYPRVRDKTIEAFAQHPGDAERLRAIVDHVRSHDVRLPNFDRLTVHRLRSLGLGLGMGDGYARIHWLLDEAWDGSELSDVFLRQVMTETDFAVNPLFAVLQETIYPQDSKPTAWAAERIRHEFPEFDEAADPLLFTGEMIYPWMFEEIRALRPFAGAADLLASADDWTPLYDTTRLAANEVPVAAVIYHDDMYVDAGLQHGTARAVGNLRTWVTNEWEHDGVTASGDRVLARLMDMARGR